MGGWGGGEGRWVSMFFKKMMENLQCQCSVMLLCCDYNMCMFV